MGKPTGFLEHERHDRTYAAPEERVQHFREFIVPLSNDELTNRPLVAWIAACLIAIMAARSTIKFRIGMI